MADARVFKVLNVDDYEVARYAKSRVLRQAQFEVVEARTGSEALRLVRSELPDLVLLDVKLPDVDGIEVCRQIKSDAATASVLVLQVSATFTDETYRIRALESGADSYLVEPVEPDELLATVRALLRLRLAEEAARTAAQEAERGRREAETFAELAGTLNASLDLDATLQAIGRAARALCASDFVRVALRDTESGGLVLRYRVDEAVRPYPGPALIETGRGVGGHVLRTGRAFRTGNYLEDPRLGGHDTALARAEGVVAALAVPVLVDGQLEGILYALNRRRQPFSDHDETTLLRLADHAALAIRNSRLYARAQAARADAEAANRAKDEFLAVLSHELRTPLQPILGWVQVARASNLDAATVVQALDTIERNARSQAQLIDDLLDVSAIITGKLRLAVRAVALGPVVEAAIDVVRPAAESKSISISSVLDPAAGPVSGDPDRLQQVCWNLVSNAVKFTPRGGQVQVRLQRVESHAELTVSDTGQGIGAEFLPHVFERFRQADSSSTRQHSGLGLGLAIVRHLVELHGGTVRAESAGAGQGASFTVRLPRLPLSPVAAERYSTADAPALPSIVGVRVLVVDDEPDSRNLLSRVLTAAGAQVRLAASTAEALDAMTPFAPDVIVSDLEMPGEDGLSLIRKIRGRSRDEGGRTPAAALTAYARNEDRTRALAAGYQTHLAKPAPPSELVAMVAALAGRRLA